MSELSDILQRFRQSPAVLEAALAGVTEDEAKFSPAPGNWSIREITRHLADTEIVAGMRLRAIAAEDRPNLALFDQDLWASRLNYNACDPNDSLRDFATVRAINAAMLESLPPEAFDREGLHPVRGVTTLRFWAKTFAKHVDNHAQQIRNAREAWKAR